MQTAQLYIVESPKLMVAHLDYSGNEIAKTGLWNSTLPGIYVS
jgi:hypothetical protein